MNVDSSSEFTDTCTLNLFNTSHAHTLLNTLMKCLCLFLPSGETNWLFTEQAGGTVCLMSYTCRVLTHFWHFLIPVVRFCQADDSREFSCPLLFLSHVLQSILPPFPFVFSKYCLPQSFPAYPLVFSSYFQSQSLVLLAAVSRQRESYTYILLCFKLFLLCIRSLTLVMMSARCHFNILYPSDTCCSNPQRGLTGSCSRHCAGLCSSLAVNSDLLSVLVSAGQCRSVSISVSSAFSPSVCWWCPPCLCLPAVTSSLFSSANCTRAPPTGVALSLSQEALEKNVDESWRWWTAFSDKVFQSVGE